MTPTTIGMLGIRILVLILIAALLTRVLRRATAAERHSVWMLATVGVLVLPALNRYLPSLDVISIPWQLAGESSATTSAAVITPATRELPERPGAPVIATKPQRQVTTGTTRWASVDGLAALWIAGAVFFLLRLWRAHALAGSVAKRGSRAPRFGETEVRLSSDVLVPFVYGVRRPIVVLPEVSTTWPAAQRRAALLHEQAHVIRHDGLALLAGQICLAVYWWHPAVWYATRAAAAERERACDDVVIGAGVHPSEYGGYLMEVAELVSDSRVHGLATAMLGSRVGLAHRITALLDPLTPRSAPRRRRIACCGAIVASAAIALGAAAPAAAPRPASAAPRVVGLPESFVTPAPDRPVSTKKAVKAIEPAPGRRRETAPVALTVCAQASDRDARLFADEAIQVRGAGALSDARGTRLIWTGVNCTAWIRFRAPVEASTDELNIVVPNGSEFIAHEEAPAGVREFNAATQTMTLDSHPVTIGDAEREWIASVVREYLHRTGARARSRAVAALSAGGTTALLAEVNDIPRATVRADYLIAGFDRVADTPARAKYIHDAAGLLDNAGARATFLLAVPGAWTKDETILAAIYRETAAIEPDAIVENILVRIPPPRPVTPALRPLIENIIATISTRDRRAALSAFYLDQRP